jgi:hypothetical protein
MVDVCVSDPSSRENSAVGRHCHFTAEFDAECAVRLRVHGVQSWNYLPEHGPLGSVNRMRLAVNQLRRKLNMVGHEQPAEA